MRYWLLKTEPSTYSLDDLKRKGVDSWDGVRNYQARNFMMDMKLGDMVFIYYSSTKSKGLYGLAKVAHIAHPDRSQFDPTDSHFDPKASKEKPIWYCPDVRFVKKFKMPVTLEQMKNDPQLKAMRLLQKGSRLSVQPVSYDEYAHILTLL